MLGERRRRRLCTETWLPAGGGGDLLLKVMIMEGKYEETEWKECCGRCMRITCGVCAGAVVCFPLRDCRGKW